MPTPQTQTPFSSIFDNLRARDQEHANRLDLLQQTEQAEIAKENRVKDMVLLEQIQLALVNNARSFKNWDRPTLEKIWSTNRELSQRVNRIDIGEFNQENLEGYIGRLYTNGIIKAERDANKQNAMYALNYMFTGNKEGIGGQQPNPENQLEMMKILGNLAGGKGSGGTDISGVFNSLTDTEGKPAVNALFDDPDGTGSTASLASAELKSLIKSWTQPKGGSFIINQLGMTEGAKARAVVRLQVELAEMMARNPMMPARQAFLRVADQAQRGFLKDKAAMDKRKAKAAQAEARQKKANEQRMSQLIAQNEAEAQATEQKKIDKARFSGIIGGTGIIP